MEKDKSNLKSGDIIKNLAGGYYKIEQDVIPDGYKEYYGKGNTTEFEVSFKKEGTSFVLSAKDDNHGDVLDVIEQFVQLSKKILILQGFVVFLKQYLHGFYTVCNSK